MRKFIECADRRTAKKRCPWAAKVVKVYGGFICFEFTTDYEIWKNQKQQTHDSTHKIIYFVGRDDGFTFGNNN